MTDYPKDTGQSLKEWMREWKSMEDTRMAEAQAVYVSLPGDTDPERTAEMFRRIWDPRYSMI